MLEGRYVPAATLLPDGRVLVSGGTDEQAQSLASAELYDPSSGAWTATGEMVQDRVVHTATLLPGGMVLVAGGYFGNPGGGESRRLQLASAELYDPGSGSWIATGNMGGVRGGHTATLLPDGRVLVAGGCCGGSGLLASAELYDPSTGTWTATGAMIQAREEHTATLLPDGRVLVAAGYGGGGGGGMAPGPVELASAELYDPDSGTWTATGGMREARIGPTATLLPDGRVLVAGGIGRRGFLASAELYDPITGTWTATGAMVDARHAPTATLLPNGTVLVAGGYNNSGSLIGSLTSAELYDPSTGTWTATGNMVEGRSGHRAALLPDGRLMVAGGSSTGGTLASAELYDPGSGP